MKTKIIGIILIIAFVIIASVRFINHIRIRYEYINKISSYWDLSEKASTIKLKSEYINKFVTALEKSGLQGMNDALFFPTPSTDFDQNFITLKSLQKRLIDIDTMNIQSFAYQTAIQQITQQEQGEGKCMTDVFKGCWLKEHYYTYWSEFFIIISVIIELIILIVGLVLIGTFEYFLY
jgi:hypothetical protein